MSKAGFWLQYRMRFIDFLLEHYGTVRRTQLTDYFGISAPQASLDIAAYIESAPGNMIYDMKAKIYRRTPEFERKFP